ncbi:hypothetical protein GGQ85_004404, partial [Nitrobacter vulgaris]|uniref:Hsp20 family protein n=1 Tax=Nitrobacter vulgaris TaxID=29421 RepID=UPI00285618E3
LVGKDTRHVELEDASPWPHRDSIFQTKGAHLTDKLYSVCGDPVSDPMKRLQIDLRFLSYLDKAHRRTDHRMLLVAGQKSNQEAGGQYLHRGIAARAFQRRFELADHVKVVGASLINGLLTIELKRELPEEMKPRRIAIAAGEGLPKAGNKQIEAEKQAA